MMGTSGALVNYKVERTWELDEIDSDEYAQAHLKMVCVFGDRKVLCY